jgi:mRNA-degrading endonuclease YafQ of YafQ-DinJ toxin-antitoxin module
MEIRYSPKFGRQYKKLPQGIKARAEKREVLFRKNPFDPRLKTHKLHGSQEEFMSFSIDYSYRIIFEFIDASTVVFYEIGKHDIYE